MDIVAAFASLVLGVVGFAWVLQVVFEGLRDRVWNWRLGVVCAIAMLGSLTFLGASIGILFSGPRLLPPFLTQSGI
jgi:hypothetical protein